MAHAHLTAGDIAPIYTVAEVTYGTIPGNGGVYYGDVAEGGRITFQDTPNPHLAWRSGGRTYDKGDYVSTQQDAGYSASMELRDIAGWDQVISNAYTAYGTSLPSRGIKIQAGTNGRVYAGCKTDSLTISADAPGAVVKFEETVLAAYAGANKITSVIAPSDAAAVQWLGGADVDGTTIYPQTFSLSIRNNLERIRGPKHADQGVGSTSTVSIAEGRCDITLDMEVWLDDLAYMSNDMANMSAPSAITLTLGITNPKEVTLSGISWMADGQHADLKQDKMKQTLRFRADALAIATPE